MKKIVNFVLILLLVPLFSSCKPEMIELDFDSEFNRIYAEIPSIFSEDIVLPTSTSPFEVEYQVDNEDLVGNILQFELLPEDKDIEVEIKLSSGEEKAKYYITIIQVGNEELYNNITENEIFYRAFLEIDAYIPSVATSNFTLHTFDDNEDIDVEYMVNCTDIERGRVVYTFPDEQTECGVYATITYNGTSRVEIIPFVMSAVDDLPRTASIYIETDSNAQITSNLDYVRGNLSMYYGKNKETVYLEDVPLGIRLRGNSTLFMPKKSFKIKFDNKIRLTNAYQEKDWVLLANFTDQTLVRNYVAFQMSNGLNMDFTPSYVFVDVYVNNEYLGNYMLTDQIEVTNHRVDIEENVSDIDTGYLIEYDVGLYRVGLENTDENYFLINGIPFVIKSPSYTDDHYLNGHKEYIETYMNRVFDTLQNKTDYHNLINEASFIDWLIVSEVFKNVDSGYSSVYYYKDKDGLLEMGPLWDFDLSSGNQGHLGDDLRGPEGWYTMRQDKNILFYYLWQYDEFQEAFKERWNEVYQPVILPVLDHIFDATNLITYSRYQNFERWNVIGTNADWYTAPEVYALKTYDEQVWFLHDYLQTRIEWMNNEINK
jgi:hypothetical protein